MCEKLPVLGGELECVFVSVKKVDFYFCGFHKWWEDGERKNYALVFLPPLNECITVLFRADRRERIVLNCLWSSWSWEFWNHPIKLAKNALNIGYILSIFKYIKMYLIQIKSLNTVEHVFLPLRYRYSVEEALCCSFLMLSSDSFVPETSLCSVTTFTRDIAKKIFFSACSRIGELWSVSQQAHTFLQEDCSNLCDNSWLSDLNLMEISIWYLEF